MFKKSHKKLPIFPTGIITLTVLSLLFMGTAGAADDRTCADSKAVSDNENAGLISDCETLLSGRETLQGNAELNWSLSVPISEWSGIITGGEPPRVTEIDLWSAEYYLGTSLDGEIPTGLGNLEALEVLDLKFNHLSGNIPTEIGRLEKLRRLSLGHNSLRGGIPRELGLLTALESLDLSRNLLGGPIPAELGNLASLKWMHLGHAGLDGQIPKELGGLKELISLELAQNRLSGTIPEEVGGLTSLAHLGISGNELTGEIPESTGNLTNLASLDLSDNKLNGSIPPRLANLESLSVLRLNNNSLSGPVPAGMNQVVQLHLGGNRISEPIPTDLENTLFLDLSNNDLSTQIPEGLAKLTGLSHINLSNSNLQGEIPAAFGELTSLSWLDLRDNNLKGEVPGDLLTPEQLKHIFLCGNALTQGSLALSPSGPPKRRFLCIDYMEDSEGPVIGLPPESLHESQAGPFEWQVDRTDSPLFEIKNGALWFREPPDHENPKNRRVEPNEYEVRLRAQAPVGEDQDENQDEYQIWLWVRIQDHFNGGPVFAPELPGKGTTCDGSPAVGDPANRGLIMDCNTLLQAKNALEGTGELNWSRDISIREWDGVQVGDTSHRPIEWWSPDGFIGDDPGLVITVGDRQPSFRVTGIDFSANGASLNGSVPKELEALTYLARLDLSGTRLGGSLPEELMNLTNLTSLALPLQPENISNGTSSQDTCEDNAAVLDRANSGLLLDCAALLHSIESLSLNRQLNWSRDLDIALWQGVTLGHNPARVIALDLSLQGAGGYIPEGNYIPNYPGTLTHGCGWGKLLS